MSQFMGQRCHVSTLSQPGSLSLRPQAHLAANTRDFLLCSCLLLSKLALPPTSLIKLLLQLVNPALGSCKLRQLPLQPSILNLQGCQVLLMPVLCCPCSCSPLPNIRAK